MPVLRQIKYYNKKHFQCEGEMFIRTQSEDWMKDAILEEEIGYLDAEVNMLLFLHSTPFLQEDFRRRYPNLFLVNKTKEKKPFIKIKFCDHDCIPRFVKMMQTGSLQRTEEDNGFSGDWKFCDALEQMKIYGTYLTSFCGDRCHKREENFINGGQNLDSQDQAQNRQCKEECLDQSMFSFLKSVYTDEQKHDLMLIIKGFKDTNGAEKIITTNRLLYSHLSPFIQNIFKSDYTEKNGNRIGKIILSDVTPKMVEAYLELAGTGQTKINSEMEKIFDDMLNRFGVNMENIRKLLNFSW